jgi:hypothetical protein
MRSWSSARNTVRQSFACAQTMAACARIHRRCWGCGRPKKLLHSTCCRQPLTSAQRSDAARNAPAQCKRNSKRPIRLGGEALVSAPLKLAPLLLLLDPSVRRDMREAQLLNPVADTDRRQPTNDGRGHFHSWKSFVLSRLRTAHVGQPSTDP